MFNNNYTLRMKKQIWFVMIPPLYMVTASFSERTQICAVASRLVTTNALVGLIRRSAVGHTRRTSVSPDLSGRYVPLRRAQHSLFKLRIRLGRGPERSHF